MQYVWAVDPSVPHLKAENTRLKAENKSLKAENARLTAENARLAAENARLVGCARKRKGSICRARANISGDPVPCQVDSLEDVVHAEPWSRAMELHVVHAEPAAYSD